MALQGPSSVGAAVPLSVSGAVGTRCDGMCLKAPRFLVHISRPFPREGLCCPPPPPAPCGQRELVPEPLRRGTRAEGGPSCVPPAPCAHGARSAPPGSWVPHHVDT